MKVRWSGKDDDVDSFRPYSPELVYAHHPTGRTGNADSLGLYVDPDDFIVPWGRLNEDMNTSSPAKLGALLLPARRRALDNKVNKSFSFSLGRFQGLDYYLRHGYHAFFLLGPADELQPNGEAVEQLWVV